MNNEQMFAAGFRAQCAQRGVDPDALIKTAARGTPDAAEVLSAGAGGAVRGGVLGGLALGGAHGVNAGMIEAAVGEGIPRILARPAAIDALNIDGNGVTAALTSAWRGARAIKRHPGRAVAIPAAVLALLAMARKGGASDTKSAQSHGTWRGIKRDAGTGMELGATLGTIVGGVGGLTSAAVGGGMGGMNAMAGVKAAGLLGVVDGGASGAGFGGMVGAIRGGNPSIPA